MSRSLLITGSLASDAIGKILQSSVAENLTVVEFDSLLDRRIGRESVTWKRLYDFISLEAGLALNLEAENAAEFFLSRDVDHAAAEGLMTHRSFRAASMGPDVWRLAVPYLLNRTLAEKCLREICPERVWVAAGNGIHFEAWREVVQEQGVELAFLKPELKPVKWLRRLRKWWLKRQHSRRLVVTQATSSGSATTGGQALCISERLNRLLAEDGSKLTFPVTALTKKQMGSHDTARVAVLSEKYVAWWVDWKKQWLRADSLSTQQSQAMDRIGRHMVEKVYPLYAAIYENAVKTLSDRRPAMVLCDTQLGTPERMWSLAAQELGVPVIAYNYDHIASPRFSFLPDYLLADSGRSALAAIENGVPADRVVTIRSHRRTRLPQTAVAKDGRPLVVYSDSYYAGSRADIDPASCYHSFNRVVEAARACPEADFVIKFHPLREKKKAELCFVAMDETELRLRKAYIHKLHPPRNLRLVDPEESLPTYLARASVLLNYNSTSGIEAFEMGIPVVFMQALGKHIKAYPRIHEYGACLEALDKEALIQTLRSLVHEPQARGRQVQKQMAYLRDFYWPEGPSLQESLEKIQRELSMKA